MDDSKEVNDDKGENKKELKEINEKEKEPPIVQWIVLRKDLLDDLHWPRGSVVAQACHSSLAAIWAFKEEESTILYMGDIANMHKVVLETSSEKELQSLSDKLKIAGINHYLWREQPENFITSLATMPYKRTKEISKLFKKLRLFA